MGPVNGWQRYFRYAGLFALGSLGLLSVCASANDGGTAESDSPSLLRGHPSVSMTSEVVKITIQGHQTRVDCDFVFTNHGPACSVRMGFPDVGEGASDPDEEEADFKNKPPHTTFTSFRSYVDGKPAPTRLIRADTEGHYWHAKTVFFPANSTLHIRDVYTQDVGGGIVQVGQKTGEADQIGYVLHTGASWHGPIGRSEIDITLPGTLFHGTPQPVPVSRISKEKNNPRWLRANSLPPNIVVWKGPCAPAIQDRTLRFVRANWRPTQNDDIELTYNYRLPPR
ncbi:MAG TPA: hypothetical protein VFA07_05045 [Chthonomonadaceae bacterium]|nr:hypothetical protein [Chthonomonadaceae bacterium]